MRKEREQLINLVKLQAKEMEVILQTALLLFASCCLCGGFFIFLLNQLLTFDPSQALKAEINMLRHKGGHIYTPVSRH